MSIHQTDAAKAESPGADTCERVQKPVPARAYATHINEGDIRDLPEEHKQYLVRRHGTLELDPVPTFSDADPYNWPSWKKVTNLILVAFHAMMATFTAASIQSAFQDIAEDLHVSLQQTTYLTSLVIAILGGAPLFWRPIADRYGRRPVFIISLICSAVGNIGCAKSQSYSTMALCRAITAWFISPAAAIGSAVVKETFFKKDRARYMGIWTLMVTLGIPVAPFVFGFVAQHTSYRWIYWIMAIINSVQLVLYIFLGPETRYVGKEVSLHGSTRKQQYFSLYRIDPTPLSLWDIFEPLCFVTRPCIAIPAVAYAMLFLFASVLLNVELPVLFRKFNLDAQQTGYQYLGIIIGSILGEMVSGVLSDFWMSHRAKKFGVHPPAEFRLWLSYPAFLFGIVGVIVFLVQIQNARPAHWDITPVIGAGIGAAGNQLATTVLITYAVDCYPKNAASVGVFITFVRQTWGFIGPFWLPLMVDDVGLYASAGIATALIMCVSFVPTFFIQLRGGKFRST